MYRYVCRTLNAAGEGSASGTTGRWSVLDGALDEWGRRGKAAHCAARMMLCTGNRKTCSCPDAFEDVTERTCVGYVACADDARTGTRMTCGTCDLVIVVGMCDEDMHEMPASILHNASVSHSAPRGKEHIRTDAPSGGGPCGCIQGEHWQARGRRP